MKRKLVILFAFLGVLMVTGFSSCRMRYASTPSFNKMSSPRDTRRHYGAPKNLWLRKTHWGPKQYGPRPYRHRGRYRV